MENQLKSLVKKELQDVLKQNAHSIQAVLNANSAEYLGTFSTLFCSSQSLLKRKKSKRMTHSRAL